mgnify:CR=1 FL=1
MGQYSRFYYACTDSEIRNFPGFGVVVQLEFKSFIEELEGNHIPPFDVISIESELSSVEFFDRAIKHFEDNGYKYLEKENLEYQGANFSGLKRRLKTNDSSVIIEIERPRDDSIIRVSVTKNFVFNDAWAQYRV